MCAFGRIVCLPFHPDNNTTHTLSLFNTDHEISGDDVLEIAALKSTSLGYGEGWGWGEYWDDAKIGWDDPPHSVSISVSPVGPSAPFNGISNNGGNNVNYGIHNNGDNGNRGSYNNFDDYRNVNNGLRRRYSLNGPRLGPVVSFTVLSRLQSDCFFYITLAGAPRHTGG